MVTAVCNSKDILYPPNGHLVAIMGLHAPVRGLLTAHPGDDTVLGSRPCVVLTAVPGECSQVLGSVYGV